MRTLRIQFKDGTHKDLSIEKAVKVNVDRKSFFVEEMKSGNFRITTSGGLIDNFDEVKGLDLLSDKEAVNLSVKCDSENNTPESITDKKLNVEISFRPKHPERAKQ